MSTTDRLHKLHTMSHEEALGTYTHNERRMIFALESIVKTPSPTGGTLDLAVVRTIAQHALEDIGWPTARDVNGEAA